MLTLSIRTDKPEAEIGLFDDGRQIDYQTWPAHRQLAESLHQKIHELLERQHKDWQNIQGIVVFKGPGSFTGLRIGLSVANALAYALKVPLVAMEEPSWLAEGLAALHNGRDDKLALPEYGASVHITEPKH